jgi:hypothetical protein
VYLLIIYYLVKDTTGYESQFCSHKKGLGAWRTCMDRFGGMMFGGVFEAVQMPDWDDLRDYLNTMSSLANERTTQNQRTDNHESA